MPRDDWQKNTIPDLFTEWGVWPWGGAKRNWSPAEAEYAAKEGISCMQARKILSPNCFQPRSVLDVGCGLSLKSQFVGGPHTVRVGLDLHRPYLEAVETDVPWIPVCASVDQIHDLFSPNTFDLVLALDIIEHLEKDEALILLRDLESVAKVAVILETPRGFFPQDVDILGFGQDHLQTHRCGFEKEELEELGYTVFVRDHQLHPVKRVKGSDDVAAECQLLNAIKRVDGGAH